MSHGGICLYGGRKVLLPDAVPEGLVGRWTFDAVKPLDTSGHHNHAKGVAAAGPGVGTRGASASFTGRDPLEVPHSASFASKEFAVTFWVYLANAPASTGVDRFCPLLHKGQLNSDMSPSLQVNTRSRFFRLMQATDSAEHPDGEAIVSAARLPVQRWTHVAIVRKAHGMQLWINGVLEGEKFGTAATILNEGPLFVGGVPWFRDQCGLNVLIDELRFFARTISRDEIAAEAAPAMGGIEPGFMHFGCKECSVVKASESCREGYHLCTGMELHTGGYQAARTMGYLDWTSRVWTHGNIKEEGIADKLGVGLCCTDER